MYVPREDERAFIFKDAFVRYRDRFVSQVRYIALGRSAGRIVRCFGRYDQVSAVVGYLVGALNTCEILLWRQLRRGGQVQFDAPQRTVLAREIHGSVREYVCIQVGADGYGNPRV